jgi:hypothetical protein
MTAVLMARRAAQMAMKRQTVAFSSDRFRTDFSTSDFVSYRLALIWHTLWKIPENSDGPSEKQASDSRRIYRPGSREIHRPGGSEYAGRQPI